MCEITFHLKEKQKTDIYYDDPTKPCLITENCHVCAKLVKHNRIKFCF